MSLTNMFIHPAGIVEPNVQIGSGTKVWAFTHILSGAVIGKDCNICDHVFIESDVQLGDRVTVKCGVQIWNGISIEDDVFIGPNVTFTNDPFPRSKQYPESFHKTYILKGASIGANATILPGITIHQNAMIGAGSVVTKDVPPNAIVRGNPAQIVGYSNLQKSKIEPITDQEVQKNTPLQATEIGQTGAFLYHLPAIKDLRGDLSFTEFGKDLPFLPRRCFWVFGVPNKEIRGEHAHKECGQFLVAVSGSVSVLLDNGTHQSEIVLNKPHLGIYIPPGVWGVQYKYSQDAVLMVLASHGYDANDYIRNYDDFLTYKKS
ncbi:WxcM-like domain-containing protein [Polynucleobacter sp. 30F-ANTBAC]|uniref:WxcM-like domain-containing protein n=1 Tax=Polynucleobacter sp. 30F-ANTBAC TaxID=2689095 RepID=UPI0021058936|nr:WxcM-like domain-containing protein [Polynucleobacter sp. 30F-ANTBAC]